MKKRTMIVFMVLFALMLVQGVIASSTLATVRLTPDNSAVISGNAYVLTAVIPVTHKDNITNVSFYYTPAGGAETLIAVNNTNNLTTYTKKWDTQVLFDTTSYTISVKFQNATAASSTDFVVTNSTTGVTSDNTKPICSITTPSANTEYGYDFITSLNAYNSTGCTWKVNNDGYTGTIVGLAGSGTETCTYTFTEGDLSEGSYSFSAETTDGTNVTQCSSIEYVRMDTSIPGSRGKFLTYTFGTNLENAPGQSNTTGIVVIALIGIGLWYAFKKK